MSGGTIDLRCSCGRTYHADPAHAGKLIRCRCGRTIRVRVPRQRRLGGSAASRLGGWGAQRLKVVASFWRRPGVLARAFPRATRYAPLLAWAYLAGVIGATLALRLFGDRWPPATALLFGPRWLLLVPVPLLVILAVLFRPALLLPVLGGLGVALGPAMGYRTGWRTWLGAGTGSLRIITYNIDWSRNPGPTLIPNELSRLDPDVMVFQECNPIMREPAHWPAGWTVRADGSICLGSRYPILLETADSAAEVGDLGDTGIARFFRLEGPEGPIEIAVVHLETPRKGLETLRYSGDISRMDPSTLVRSIGSSRVRRWVGRQSGDVIVAGDFNMPVESVIYRKDWSDCRNAFSTVGRGFGYTRILRRFSVRIDHVLTCGEGWTPVRAFVGPDLGSDHLPLIVDLKRR